MRWTGTSPMCMCARKYRAVNGFVYGLKCVARSHTQLCSVSVWSVHMAGQLLLTHILYIKTDAAIVGGAAC